MDDTSPEATERYFDLLRRLEPRQRLEIAVKLINATRELAMIGLKAEASPHELSSAQVRCGLAERLYGREVAERYFAVR